MPRHLPAVTCSPPGRHRATPCYILERGVDTFFSVSLCGRRLRTWVPALVSLVLLISIFQPATAAAQASAPTRGTLTGVVRADDGTPLSHVDLHLVRLGLQTQTDEAGRFKLTGIPEGTHHIRIERLGYQTLATTVTIRANRESRLDVPLETAPYQLSELVVTGTAGARDALTTPQSVNVVSNQALHANRSASLGALVANEVPTIANLSTGPVAGIPVIRGLSGTRVRLMQNGVAQEYYQYGARHHAPTSLSEAERVEVVSGVSSLLYGSDALGGAINVLTRDLPAAPEGRTHLGGQVETEYASVNGEVAGLVDIHAAHGGLGFRAGIERREAGNLNTPDSPTFFDPDPATGIYGDPKYAGELPFTNYEQWSGYLQSGIRGAFGRIDVFGNFWDSRQNFLLPQGGPSESTTNPPLGLGLELGNLNLSAKGSILAGGAVIRPVVAFQRTTRQAAAEGVTYEDVTDFPVDLEKDVLTTRLEVGHRGGNGTLGAEYQFVDGRRNGPVELEPASKVDNLSIFGLQEFPLGRTLLSVGARLDYRRQEAGSNELTADPDLLEQSYAVFSGSAGLSQVLTENLTLAVTLGTGFRAPTIFEMFANGVHGGVAAFQQGDPELDPERSVNGDVALRFRNAGFQGELSAYAQRIQDYIFLANTGASTETGLPILGADQTDATLRGAEGHVEADITDWVAVGGSFAFIEGTGDDLEDMAFVNPDGDLPLLPENRFGGFVEFRAPTLGTARGSRLRVQVTHFLAKDSGGRIEPFSQFDNLPFGTASTEAYTLMALQARTVIELGTMPLSVNLFVENLLDEAYRGFLDTYKGYALSPGRNLRVRLSAPLSLNR